jgi:hypothetical protein
MSWVSLLLLAVAAVLAVVALFLEWRRPCPVCGKPFTRVLHVGAAIGRGKDPVEMPAYDVRLCRWCGARQVERPGGTQLLPAEGWREAAARFAGRPAPQRGFEVIREDAPSPPDAG